MLPPEDSNEIRADNEVSSPAPDNGAPAAPDIRQQQPMAARTISRSESYDPELLLRPHQDVDYQFQPRMRHISGTVVPSVPNGRLRRNFSSSSVSSNQGTLNHKVKHGGAKNGNMVLQLVLPQGMQHSSSFENGNYFSSPETPSAHINLKRRDGRGSFASNQSEFFSPVRNGAYINRAFSNADLHDYDNSHPQTPNTDSETHLLPPTPPEEKKRIFREYLTTILSCIYAVFIVTLGAVIYITDAFVGTSPVAETFTMYLVLTAFAYLIYLITSIRMYTNKKNKYNNLLEHNQAEDVEFIQSPDGKYQVSIALPAAAKISEPLPHHYCLSKGRHSGSFYLKVGAAGFCLGHLIHAGLLLGYQVVFLTSDSDAFFECASVVTLVLDIIYPIYSFGLLYFIFKYSNVIINKNIPLARFGLMHCISSSLCFWVWTIIRETLESIDQPMALPLTEYSKQGADQLRDYLNGSVFLFTRSCATDKGLRLIYQNFSPYLYPFSVEYSILVVGILFIVWQSIGMCREDEETCNSSHSDSPESAGKLESNIVIHADCHAANKGLFCGIFVLVLCVVSIILFFIAISDQRYINLAVFINGVTEVIVLSLMIITGLWAYRQITRLDHNHHHISLLDDLLLFICIPAFFVNAIFSIIPAVHYGNALSIIMLFVQITQVLIQTPMIIDGLRRCSNGRDLQKAKPGREVLTFLIVCNVALWITQTFEVKSSYVHDDRYEFYGRVLWSVIGHLCLPLMMFYRFHASVCIADIWKYAYEPASH